MYKFTYRFFKFFAIIFLTQNICFSQSSIYENFISYQIHNPAFSYIESNNSLSCSYQKKYIGFSSGTPQSVFLAYNGLRKAIKRTKNRFGFGANFHLFSFGNIKELIFGVPISFHINLHTNRRYNWFLSFGSEVVYSQYIIDEKNLKLNQFNDPALNYNILNVKKFDANTGLYLYNELNSNNNSSKNFTTNVGIFAVNVLEKKPIGGNIFNNINKRLLFASVGIEYLKKNKRRVFLSANIFYARSISINIFLQILRNADYLYPYDIFVSKITYYKRANNRKKKLSKIIEFALNFRSNGVVIPTVSSTVADKFEIGIAYGFNTPLSIKGSTMRFYGDNYGSPEIKLAWHF